MFTKKHRRGGSGSDMINSKREYLFIFYCPLITLALAPMKKNMFCVYNIINSVEIWLVR